MRILGVHSDWYEHVTNIVVSRRTNLPHFGSLIAARRYSLFGHVVRLSQDVPSNMALKICRDMSISRRIPQHVSAPEVVRALRGLPNSSPTQVFQWVLPGSERVIVMCGRQQLSGATRFSE